MTNNLLTQQQINLIIDFMIKQKINETNLKTLRFSILSKLPDAFKSNGNSTEVERILQVMQDKDLIVIDTNDSYDFTENARQIHELGGWLDHLRRIRGENESIKEMQSLTKKQLELSIREMQINFTQIRYWWLILIFTMIVSGIASAWFQSLFK